MHGLFNSEIYHQAYLAGTHMVHLQTQSNYRDNSHEMQVVYK